MSRISEFEKIEGSVWCDKHGDLHDESTNPYDIPTERTKEGKPIFLEYADDGSIVVSEPECGPDDWRSLYHGGENSYEAT